MATTTSARLPRRGPGASLRERLPAIGWVGLAIFVEAVLAAAVVQPRFLPLLALAALAAGAAMLFRFPFAAAVVVLLLVASFVSPRLLEAGAGGLTVRGWEAILGGLMVAALLRPRAASWGGAAGGFVVLFLVLLLISSVLALQAGADSADVVTWGRGFAAIAVFFVVVRLFPDEHHRSRLLAWAAAIGAITGLVAGAVQAGVSLPVIMGGDFYSTFVDEGSGGLTRVRLPGIALSYALFVYAAVRAMRARGTTRVAWGVALLGCGLNLLLSQNRNMWAGVIVGVAAILLVGGAGLRRPVIAIAALLFSTLAVVTLVGVEVDSSGAVAPVLERGEVLLNPGQARQDPSVQARLDETALAWNKAKDNLLIGIGPGVRYGAYYSDERSPGVYERAPQFYVHNQYLYLMLIGGIPLLVAFLLFVGASLRAGWDARRDPEQAALFAGVLMLMLSAVVMLSFADSNMLAALALLAGALVAARTSIAEPEPGAR